MAPRTESLPAALSSRPVVCYKFYVNVTKFKVNFLQLSKTLTRLLLSVVGLGEYDCGYDYPGLLSQTVINIHTCHIKVQSVASATSTLVNLFSPPTFSLHDRHSSL